MYWAVRLAAADTANLGFFCYVTPSRASGIFLAIYGVVFPGLGIVFCFALFRDFFSVRVQYTINTK